MGTESKQDDRNTPEYLSQLLKDKKQMQAFPNVFVHVEKLLDDEVNRVRVSLFHHNGVSRDPISLPEGYGPAVTVSEKVFVPVKEHPDFNFVGRILGPRGITIKELEKYTQCKVMVRGKGSMRDKAKEEQMRGKPNWEHLNEDLHVLLSVEETPERAKLKLAHAIKEVRKLLVPAPEGEDDLKKRQLMELAIINGTYRDTTKPTSTTTTTQQSPNQVPRLISPMTIPQLRSPNPAGTPLIFTQRMPTMAANAAMFTGGPPPPLISPTDPSFMYNPYEYPGYAFATPALFDYQAAIDQTAAAAAAATGAVKVRRAISAREHPYHPRVTTLP